MQPKVNIFDLEARFSAREAQQAGAFSAREAQAGAFSATSAANTSTVGAREKKPKDELGDENYEIVDRDDWLTITKGAHLKYKKAKDGVITKMGGYLARIDVDANDPSERFFSLSPSSKILTFKNWHVNFNAIDTLWRRKPTAPKRATGKSKAKTKEASDEDAAASAPTPAPEKKKRATPMRAMLEKQAKLIENLQQQLEALKTGGGPENED